MVRWVRATYINRRLYVCPLCVCPGGSAVKAILYRCGRAKSCIMSGKYGMIDVSRIPVPLVEYIEGTGGEVIRTAS